MLVDRMLTWMHRDAEEYRKYGKELYENKYLDSMSTFLFERGYLTPKQVAFAEELLSQIRSHWYYFEENR